MKRSILTLVFIYSLAGVYAQNFLISFTGSGESATIDSIKVENLTQGTNVTLTSGESLRLKDIITSLKYPDEFRDDKIYIYPNPVTDYATIEFNVAIPAKYTIELFDLSGKRIVHTENVLSQGKHTYQISNLNYGIYTLRIKSSEFNFTGKIISRSQNSGFTHIKYQGQTGDLALEGQLKGAQEEYQMQYTSGDRLRFTAFSGNYITILTDIPNESKDIAFDFVDCTDGDNNIYPVVKIGTQLWTAQNLRTTRFNDGSALPLVSDNKIWDEIGAPAYCWYNNDSNTFAAEYGALYNSYTFETDSLCPVGWHVPSNEEWTVLEVYLEDRGYGYEGSGDDIGKSLAATSGWTTSEIAGAVGNNQASNNLSGFSGLPGGHRRYDGTFTDIGEFGYWWSSTWNNCYADFRSLSYSDTNIKTGSNDQELGFSVRCLKD